MKTLTLLLTAILASALLLPKTHAEPEQLLSVIKDLQIQQAQIDDNEAKIEAKVADLTEAIRVARLYISRIGGAHKPPPPPKK